MSWYSEEAWRKRWRSFTTHRQIIVIDHSSGRPARTFHQRPLLLAVATLLLLCGGYLLGYQVASRTVAAEVVPDYLQIKRQLSRCEDQIAEMQATLLLKEQELEGTRAELAKQQEELQRLNGQIITYKNIVEGKRAVGKPFP